jgi:hypothetical protein
MPFDPTLPVALLKLRNLTLSALMLVALASPAYAADTTSEGRNEEYRKSQEAYRRSLEDSDEAYRQSKAAELEAYRQEEEAHRRDFWVYGALAFALGGGCLAYLRRNVRRTLELAEQQKTILEEIRDLLKKP